MVRSSPLALLIVSLGSIMPAAWAADPPCPSQITPGTPQGNTAATSQGTPAAPAAAAPAGAAPGAATASAATASAAAQTQAARAPPAEGGPLEITADHSEFSVADGKGTLSGNVEVRQGQRVIRTNQAEVDRNKGTVETQGHIDYSDPLVHVTGASGRYSEATGADFHSAEFTLRQRAGRGAAQDLALTPQGVVRLKKVRFTTCPAHDNSWQMKADSIVLDTRNKIGTGRDAQIDFMGVPLMYLPWVSFPLSSERKSGFLFPTIGTTSYGGLQLSVPYYWNIAPNADFTFEPTEYSRSGPDLGGDLRFLTENQHGELDWNYLPYDKQFDGSRERIRLNEVAELPADWRATLNAQEVSDPFYFENFSQGPEGASTAFLERSALLSYRDEHWRIDGEAQQYQTIDYTLPVDERPYARVPRLAASADYSLGPQGLFHYGFDSEVVDFQRPGGTNLVDGWRADFMPGISLDLTGPGYFVRPALAWRATQYELDYTAPGEPDSPSRTLPIASFDSGLLFERAAGSHDQRKLTLEPRILYLKVPYRDQDDLPVFDTALPDLLNPVQLFRTNRYVGPDRVSDADQMSFGVTSRLLDAQSGRQFISATLGQIYYFETPRVTLPGTPAITDKHSDLVAQLSLTAFEDWSAGIGVDWDPESEASEQTQVNLQYKPQSNAVLNFAYRYERFVFDQVEFSGAWPIKGNWNVFTREVYSLSDHEYQLMPPPAPTGPDQGATVVAAPPLVGFLERFAGFEYRSCCWRVRFGVRRYVSTHTGTQNTGLWLQLELAGLASVGSASDASLGQEIRGYTPVEATNLKPQGPLKGIW